MADKKKTEEELDAKKKRDFYAELNDSLKTARHVKKKFFELVKDLEKKP